jgi:carboxyl-terminal processing protease
MRDTAVLTQRSSWHVPHPILIAIVLVASAAIAGCGGGGSKGNGGGGGGGGGSGWQQGVFADYNDFYARCKSPRSGTDPATMQPYPDKQGSTTDENNFLRSYSNDTYLWYSEITDRDPGLYNDPLAYFDLLKTNATTMSGQPKDKFHFTYPSDQWFQLSQSGVEVGYGVQWAILSSIPPRELVIAYTEPNTPATNLPLPLARGASIIAIDDVDIDDNTQAGVDTLNAGIFPASAGETHKFAVLDLGSPTPREVLLTSQPITSTPVQDVQVLTTASGNVGYMLFNDHIATAEQELIDAVNQLNASNGGQGIDDLVLDIRYNGGGYLAIASELAYMIAGPTQTAGETFEEIQFNDKYPSTDPLTGQALAPTPFYSQTLGSPFNGNGGTAGAALPSLNLSRVYVLTGAGTCSASESIINSLRGIGVDVYQIGSTTCGKPYGFYPTDNCGTTFFTIQFRGINAAGFGDYTDGFSPDNTAAGQAGTTVPGCSVADDFSNQLGDPMEGRLSAALAYRAGAGCPAATGFAPPGTLGKPSAPLGAAEPYIPKSPWRTNRILRPDRQ